ncbi:hypothetical protein ACFLUU_04790 [Chloroflexota bacterium]
MIKFIERIIRRMKEIARTMWTVCYSLFGVFIIGGVQALIFLDGKSYQGLVLISLAILALVCLIIALYTSSYDIITTFRRHRRLKTLRHLRGYVIDMSHLGRDFMAENDNRKAEQLLKSFKTLYTEIEGYIRRRIPNELTVWEKPLDNQLAIAIKESIGKLEDIISRYENLVSE